jgi:hypothetical protein
MNSSKTKNILSYADIFVYKPQFNVNRKNGYHSLFSFFNSFIFYIFFILMAIYFSDDWIEQINPQVSITGSKIDKNGDMTNLSYDRFFDYFTIKKHYSIDKNPNDILEKANLTKDNFFTISLQIINDTTILYKFEKNLPCKIKGNELQIEDRLYVNSTYTLIDMVNNLTKENIYLNITKFAYDPKLHLDILYENKLFDESRKQNFKIFQNYSFSFYSPKNYHFDIDYINGLRRNDFGGGYEDPFDQEYYISTNAKNYIDQYLIFSLTKLEVEDNRGNIFYEKTSKYEFESVLYNKRFTNNRRLLYMFFQNKSNVYVRKYKKLQNVFADIGGILTSLMTIFKIISNIFNVRFFNYEIINLLFQNESNNEIKDNINNNFELNQINKNKINIKVDNFNVNISSNRDFKLKSIQKQSIEDKSFSNVNDKLNLKSIKEKSNYNKNESSRNNISNSNYNIINYKEKLKEELEKLKQENYFKKGDKLFFQKERKKDFLTMTNKEFAKLFIPIKKIKNQNQLSKEKIFKIAEEKLSQYLDVFHYFDLQEDFKKLKMILLDKNQDILFDFLKKRSIEEVSCEKYFENLYESIINYKEKTIDMNNIDLRILENLNNKIKKFIE